MKIIKLSDIISLPNLKLWIKKHINIYDNKEIPSEHLKVIIDYLEERVKGDDFPHEKMLWFGALNRLKSERESYEQFKKRHK